MNSSCRFHFTDQDETSGDQEYDEDEEEFEEEE